MELAIALAVVGLTVAVLVWILRKRDNVHLYVKRQGHIREFPDERKKDRGLK